MTHGGATSAVNCDSQYPHGASLAKVGTRKSKALSPLPVIFHDTNVTIRAIVSFSNLSLPKRLYYSIKPIKTEAPNEKTNALCGPHDRNTFHRYYFSPDGHSPDRRLAPAPLLPLTRAWGLGRAQAIPTPSYLLQKYAAGQSTASPHGPPGYYLLHYRNATAGGMSTPHDKTP